jgi:hypothetical protein
MKNASEVLALTKDEVRLSTADGVTITTNAGVKDIRILQALWRRLKRSKRS